MTRWNALEICAMASFALSTATCVVVVFCGLTPLTAGMLTASLVSACAVLAYGHYRGG